jgi:ketosteroid isomerase-like protein
MSQPTPEMIRAGFDAFNRRDIEAWLATFAEDCEGHDLKEYPDTDVHYGHPGQRVWLAKEEEVWGVGFKWEPMSFLEGDGVVVVETRASGAGPGGHVPAEVTFHLVLRFRDDKIVWAQGFLDRAGASKLRGCGSRPALRGSVRPSSMSSFHHGRSDAWAGIAIPPLVVNASG